MTLREELGSSCWGQMLLYCTHIAHRLRSVVMERAEIIFLVPLTVLLYVLCLVSYNIIHVLVLIKSIDNSTALAPRTPRRIKRGPCIFQAIWPYGHKHSSYAL
jgi:hypothetical protein